MIFLKRRALMTRASFNYKTVSGIGSAVLENCVETKFKRLVLFGNSKQGENPSIESPKEIKNSGKYDETSGKYVLDVEVAGKNLVPPELDFVPFGNNDPKTIEFDPKTNSYKLITRPDNFNQVTCRVRFSLRKGTYVISRKIQIDGVNIELPIGLQVYYADTKKPLYHQETGIFRKFILKEDTNVLINLGHMSDKTQKEAIIYEVQLEKSDVPTPYEPYHEPQTVQLQLDEPLRGIGEYKDVVTKDGILRRIKEIVLDESTGFETYWATLDKTFAFISPIIKDATVINFTPNRLLCNYFKVLPYGLDGTDEEVCVLFNRRFHMRFLKERNIDTVEKLKEWLKQNPIKIQYLLQEPVLEPFENNLGNLYTNDGTTIVSVDSGEVETGIEVEYAVKS